MYDLILDSSNSELLIAVAKNNNIIDRIEYEAWQRQSELMTFELDKLFSIIFFSSSIFSITCLSFSLSRKSSFSFILISPFTLIDSRFIHKKCKRT